MVWVEQDLRVLTVSIISIAEDASSQDQINKKLWNIKTLYPYRSSMSFESGAVGKGFAGAFIRPEFNKNSSIGTLKNSSPGKWGIRHTRFQVLIIRDLDSEMLSGQAIIMPPIYSAGTAATVQDGGFRCVIGATLCGELHRKVERQVRQQSRLKSKPSTFPYGNRFTAQRFANIKNKAHPRCALTILPYMMNQYLGALNDERYLQP